MERGAWWVAALLVAVMAIGPVTGLVTDGWWFASVGYSDVFRTVVGTQAVLGLLGGLAAIVLVGGSARLAVRSGSPRVGPAVRPGWATSVAKTSPLSLADAITALIALGTAAAAAGTWEQALLFVHGGAFGEVDPVWQLDAGFYVFDLPFLRTIVRALATLLGLAVVVSLGTYLAQGTLRLRLAQQDGQLVATGVVLPAEAQRHLARLVATALVALALSTWLARYTAMAEPHGLVAGPGFAELYARLPLLTFAAVGLTVAAMAAVAVVRRGSILGGIAVIAAIGALEALVTLVPAAVQRFGVLPNELSREAPQIEHHVAATRYAFGLDTIVEHELSGVAPLDADVLARNRATIDNIRLWDHQPLLDAFSQVQEIRSYYGFVGADDDRYVIDGQLRQLVVSPRELTASSLPEAAQTWVNTTMIYTHGYGVAVGPVNAAAEQGLPELFVRDVPPKVRYPEVLRVDRPEIYFGEATRHPVFVDTRNAEFDFPKGDDNAYTRYAGRDGVRLGVLGRLLYAIRLGSSELLLSGDLTRDSRVLTYRQVRERAKHIAPFLTFDEDPYLVIHEGRLVWLLDAYTSSPDFPYAETVEGVGNYLRNPVKVTIDAYDGNVLLYRVDDAEPIAAAWARAFPGLFRPIDALPAGLRAHLRYPAGQFAVQARLFATYHMVDPQVFYNREDEWEVPATRDAPPEPYHAVMGLPDPAGEARAAEEFLLLLPFSPKGKPNLAAWMAARSDGPAYGELHVYKFPKDTLVFGPRMVMARINQDDAISEKLSLWNQQGSAVELGTLMVIPIESSLVYVQPLYLRAAHGSIPELKRVIVAYEDRIAMAETLDEGLAQVFGSLPPRSPDGGTLVLPAVTTVELIRQAGMRWDAAQRSLGERDLAGYAEHVRALGEILDALRSGVEEAPPAP